MLGIYHSDTFLLPYDSAIKQSNCFEVRQYILTLVPLMHFSAEKAAKEDPINFIPDEEVIRQQMKNLFKL